MPIEREPANLTPKGYRPPESIPIKVQTGESWETIAASYGMDAWSLIEFNFPTIALSPTMDVKTAELNWYLREHVGCTTPTDDGKNWMFTSDASPGRISVPSGSTLKKDLGTLAKIQDARRNEKYFKPTQGELAVWFNYTIAPLRTEGPGFDVSSRLTASPKALLVGNTPNPNGLCGDAAAFVSEQYASTFLRVTASGEAPRRVLWRGGFGNHVANIFVPSRILGVVRYEYSETVGRPVQVSRRGGAVPAPWSEVRDLLVLDLYFMTPLTLERWWLARPGSFSGTIEIGLEHELGN